MRYPTIVAVSALASIPSTFATPLHKRQINGTMAYDFDSLTPSPDIQWTPCFDQFTCTVLDVPLDYEDESVGTVGIAFVRWSTNSTSNSTQDILVNPGGPGASGVQLLIGGLSTLHQIVGTDYNIVGFDPRGVNNSGPDLSCFSGQEGTFRLYDEDFGYPTDVNDTKALMRTWKEAGAFGDWCSQVHSGENSTAKYANTVATATDMLHYTELLAKSKGENPEESQLWYYGASYGTVLGSTFAALFPNRVGRLILDGVVDVEDYYQGKWQANIPDADEAFATFFTYCFEAGNEACVFWDSSVEAIEARFHSVRDKLAEEPIMVTNPSAVQYPVIVTIETFKYVLTQVPYFPNTYYPLFGRILAELEQGNGSLLAQTAGVGLHIDECSGPNIDDIPDLEPRHFIACTDGNGRFNLSTFDSFREHVELMVDESEYLGESWAAGTSVNCRNLNIKAPESQVFTGTPSANTTSNPILLLSTKLDPVTPLRAAEKMVKQFGGSRLLVQDSVGHTTTSAASTCTWDYIRKYLKDGSLPEKGTVCEAEEIPFQTSNSVTTTSESVKILRKRHHV
ncbi:hypothetical protein K469DRAFT_654738 [Zopfia rhizophila CBS 207.26]|uniref:Peptidase S33 tripeptidyl aminopeptidase-like C-terminal domain-containing protein n=1 Tax=Zopfia rhizophila CBS 207.26 TaxID=1314779 RepID=A0A6A6ELI7_9PEZI|nr:hypothetical protein K469DRAFT_654738 [Zopfia rhizophila CBS 207.26]